MKSRTLLAALASTALLILESHFPTASAQGTAFTYQGRLNDGVNPANGNYDLQFTIYDTPIGFNTIAGPITNSAVGVTN